MWHQHRLLMFDDLNVGLFGVSYLSISLHYQTISRDILFVLHGHSVLSRRNRHQDGKFRPPKMFRAKLKLQLRMLHLEFAHELKEFHFHFIFLFKNRCLV